MLNNTQPDRSPGVPRARLTVRSLSQAISCLLTVGCLPSLSALGGPTTYRTPWLVIAYPERGDAVPPDRPLVVFRFASREADDPIDPSSFRAVIDGADRTARFRLTVGEAWALLADSIPVAPVVAPGPHAVSARICSARGACARLDATLLIGPAALPPQPR
jgi:hypothetical protein